MLTVSCPHCEAEYDLADYFAGIEIECESCHKNFLCQNPLARINKLFHPNDIPKSIRKGWFRKTIVFTNGCFDIIHPGHIKLLQQCKEMGTVVVGLNSDASVRFNKGHKRPINNQYDRAEVLSALECVDFITIFSETTPTDLIRKVHPNILVKGADWKDKNIAGASFVESYNGKVVFVPTIVGYSTTKSIAKVKEK